MFDRFGITDYRMFHVDTNAQDNTGVLAPAGTEAAKPVQPDHAIAPDAPVPSKAANPQIGTAGEPIVPGQPSAPIQNPTVADPDLYRTEDEKKKLAEEKKLKEKEVKDAEKASKKEDKDKPKEVKAIDDKKLDEKKKELDDAKKAEKGQQTQKSNSKSGPAHDVTGQPHNELPA